MNKNIEIEITKLKLDSMNSLEIFKWLEQNKENYKHIVNTKEIVSILYSRNDKLINIGLAMYSRGYTYNMYLNTNNHEEKLAYLSSEINDFQGETGDIIIGLIAEYNELESLNNNENIFHTEDKLKAFFSNPNIYRLRCILMDLYCRTCESRARLKRSAYGNWENVFKDIDEVLWLKLISYTTNQKILSEYDKTIDENFAPDKCSNYLNMFWMLFSKIETSEKNVKMLVETIEKNDAIRNNHSFASTPEIISRWQDSNENTYFLFARYYLAQTNENLLSDKNNDLAIRKAYYRSRKFVKELNQNLPDESRLDDMYSYRENYTYYVDKFEEYYKKDEDDFLTEIIDNKFLFLDNLLLQHALSEICGKDILYSSMLRDRIEEIDKEYPNRFNEYDDLTEVDKLESESEKKQYVLEKIQDIDSKITENTKISNSLSDELLNYTNQTHILLMVIVVLEILNLFL